MTKAVIYTRFSPRPNAEKCDSCKKQEERCRTYCANKGYIIEEVWQDFKVSGGILDRPELASALKAMEFYKPGAILVVDSVDRLARDMLVQATIMQQVSQSGNFVEYANGSPASDTPEGELLINILAAFATYERARIRYATSRGMKRRQENGEWFGKPPVGFQLDPECKTQLIPCKQEQDAMARAKEISAYHTNSQLAELLTSEFGLFRGRPWSARTVGKILSQPFTMAPGSGE